MKSTGTKRSPFRTRLHRWRRNVHGIPHGKLIFSSAGILLTGAVAISVCTAGGVFSEKTGSAGNSTEVRAEASAEQMAETVSLSGTGYTDAASETKENTSVAENTEDTADSVSFFGGLKTKVEANSFFKSLTGGGNTQEENLPDAASAESPGETAVSDSSDSSAREENRQAESPQKEETDSQAETPQKEETGGQAESPQKEETGSQAEAPQKQEEALRTDSSQELPQTEKSVQSSSSSPAEEKASTQKTEDGKLDFCTRSYLRVELKVENVRQNPELPTGCESVAATIARRSVGYTDLEKCTIADEYLTKGTNYAVSYVGNPHTSSGAGCFPPAIVSAVNKYLREQGSSLRASDLTGTDLEELLALVDSGYPVIIWNTQGNVSARTGGASVTYNGTVYQWYHPEHCMVLYGYDREKDAVLISDPIDGNVERSYQQFKKNYDAIGQYAVVIQ